MKRTVIHTVVDGMATILSKEQLNLLENILTQALDSYEVIPSISEEEQQAKANAELLQAYLSAKKIEGLLRKRQSAIINLLLTRYLWLFASPCAMLQLTIYATIYPAIKNSGKSVE